MTGYRPRARRTGLIVREVSGELVVYDLERDTASCLNRTAARVWECADGETSVARIARRLRGTTADPMDSQAVWLALRRLEAAHLIEADPSPRAERGPSRRDCLRELARLGVRAAALPVVASIVAPRPADAASGMTPNLCNSLPPSACVGQPCSNGKRCYYDAAKGRCRCG